RRVVNCLDHPLIWGLKPHQSLSCSCHDAFSFVFKLILVYCLVLPYTSLLTGHAPVNMCGWHVVIGLSPSLVWHRPPNMVVAAAAPQAAPGPPYLGILELFELQ